MSARNKSTNGWVLFAISSLLTSNLCAAPTGTLSLPNTIAAQLGWVIAPDEKCGGYFLEQPFTIATDKKKSGEIQVAGNFGLYALQGTSTLEAATITRDGQQITANKAFVYRDPKSFKWTKAEMIGDIHLREPNTLIIAKSGQYQFSSGDKTLMDILYRTQLQGREIIGPKPVSKKEMTKPRRINGMTAWGKATTISQNKPEIYEMEQASFTTCAPISPAWQVKGSHIVLNKQTGRGYATHARILLKSIPVLYFPYIDFSIDHQRKSGFLWPTIVTSSSEWGPSILTPFYLNMAPNYDMLITPGYLSKRGMQLSDRFRYLTQHSNGSLYLSVLPSDREFAQLQKTYRYEFSNSTDPVIQAELTRLLNSSITRKSMYFRDDTRFNEHWSSHIDYNYAGDDYYLQNFSSNLTDITQNQLLQVGELNYKGMNWNFTGRVQAYQTLHPIIYQTINGVPVSQAPVQNQYRRFPQLVLDGHYPEQAFGFEYFIENEITHFDIRNTPGTDANLPIGNRMHAQPGISLPLYWPYFFATPRFQIALSDYQLYQINPTKAPGGVHRGIPIFDVNAGTILTANTQLFNYAFQQTLEPQVYYTYIPYRNQASIPIFDTTVNTLTYEQIFNYNRFSGIDRIGDANQLGVGFTSRLIDDETGLEKARLGVGEIIYFSNRLVTLCNNASACSDNPTNPDLYRRLSPLSGILNYAVHASWNLNATSIWNPQSKQLDNATIGLKFQPSPEKQASFGYNYARSGDILSGLQTTDTQNNLKVTEFSFSWPVLSDVSMVGKWSQNWNHRHLQNLLYGLQYDSCCWAIRVAGGRAFTQYQDQTPQFNTEYYIQFALKGLGNIGSGNASSASNLLSSFNSYNTQFG